MTSVTAVSADAAHFSHAPIDPADDAPTDRLGQLALSSRLFLDTWLSHLAAVCLTAIILVVLGGVVARYGFNSSFTWTEEASLWLFTYLIFTALPIATHRSKNVAMPMGVRLLTPRGKRVVDFMTAVAVTYTINLMLGGLTLPCGLLVFIPAATTKTSIQPPFRAAMPFFLILVVGLAVLTYVPWISLMPVHAFY